MNAMLPANFVIAIAIRSCRVAASVSWRRRCINISMFRSRTEFSPWLSVSLSGWCKSTKGLANAGRSWGYDRRATEFPFKSTRLLHGIRAAGNGGDTGAADFNQTERTHQLDERIDLVGGARDFENEAG